MTSSCIEDLRCPACRGKLRVREIREQDGGDIREATLACADCRQAYPVLDSIPRFVLATNYTASFGLQWNRHARTQLDAYNGGSLSKDRFYAETGWDPSDLKDRRVLEVGCGAGRFTQVALDAGARVYALDYSTAVDACLHNNDSRGRHCLVQADLYRIPFPRGSFDRIFCLGVLQHTPDVERAFHALVPYLRAGGEIVVDLYPFRLFSLLHPRYLLRPMTSRMKPERLYELIVRRAPGLLGLSDALRAIPLVGSYLARIVPIANYAGRLPLSREQALDWAVLNTFDWLSPRYEKPQRPSTIARWFRDAGLENASVRLVRSGDTGRGGVYVGKGVRP